MAALVEGEQYGLTSGNSTGADRTCVYLKLTDSALRAVEEFQKIQNATSRTPTIQFYNDEGVIKIPNEKSSDNREGYRKFQFHVTNLHGDPKGSFDSVEQTGHSHLDLAGSMCHKISIRAQNDVFDATRQKMTQAEEESKKNCAKEIKPGAGRKVIKKVLKGGNSAILASRGIKQSHVPSTSLSNGSPNNGRRSPSNSRAVSSSQGPKPVHQSRPSSITSSYSSNPSSVSNTKPSTPVMNSSSSNRNPIMAMPYRDRIIHLLAVRPYKKPELLARLQKDGIKEKDKKSFSTVLKEVAVFSIRDNAYSLAKHLYSDVKQDWPFYTETDRQLLKRRLTKDLNGTPSRSPSVSPTSTGQASPPNPQKRTSTSSISYDIQPQPTKKQRIAHVSSYKSQSNPSAHTNGHVRKSSPVKEEATTTTPESPQGSPTTTQGLEDSKNVQSVTSSTSDSPDYISIYTVITSAEQRRKYKELFNREYEEYMDVHKNVAAVSKTFLDLQERLKNVQQGTEDFENLQSKIIKEYKIMKSDPKYVEKKMRCDYLHNKLSYIKKRILEYDQLHLDQS